MHRIPFLLVLFLFSATAAQAFSTDDCETTRYETGEAFSFDPPGTIDFFIEPGAAGGRLECVGHRNDQGGVSLTVLEWISTGDGDVYLRHQFDRVALYEVSETFPDGNLTAECQDYQGDLLCRGYFDDVGALVAERVVSSELRVIGLTFQVHWQSLMEGTEFGTLFENAPQGVRTVDLVINEGEHRVELAENPQYGLYQVATFAENNTVHSLLGRSGSSFRLRFDVLSDAGLDYANFTRTPALVTFVMHNLVSLETQVLRARGLL